MKTAELTGAALDWAVAVCEQPNIAKRIELKRNPALVTANPSEDWAQGGPIIEREGIYLRSNDSATKWAAGALSKNRHDKLPGFLYFGQTPLIAAMRCYVASKLGDEVDVPEELK